ncbi:HvfA family oxazolone/thioamide-modified RiPP metallophore [Zestomonas carbonaria]|uniref:EF-hand domain-containing protein n=1 Tax=Zestomonas carbonaria TaxID=2762745 RepID=A0A7U7EQY2_9GAMM|nr:EF-hand domain-containing protein [Pseudomonas carbonaria]CAD5109529.1 hypothetical protein PSEWESI4_03834 [Pseudomonas carbonaria]
MTRTTTLSKTTLGMIGVALSGGMFLANTAFAVQPLAQGYLSAGIQVAQAGEGKCGEGKCGGSASDDKASQAEGKCGEGKCGEGKCGDASFSRTDTDKDGRVSRAEFLAVAAKRASAFDKIDTDHDGYISEAEAHEFLRATYEANGKPMPKGLFSSIAD